MKTVAVIIVLLSIQFMLSSAQGPAPATPPINDEFPSAPSTLGNYLIQMIC